MKNVIIVVSCILFSCNGPGKIQQKLEITYFNGDKDTITVNVSHEYNLYLENGDIKEYNNSNINISGVRTFKIIK